MSTIQAVNLKNAASASNNIVLDASGNATFAGTAAMASSFLRNRIINGDMRIDQRNAGASVTPTANVYIVDRWVAGVTQASKYSVQQNAGSVTPPVGFTNYLGTTSLSAYSIISSDAFYLDQRIEGFNVGDLGWGTANAQTVTLSFRVYSSLTGTFGGALRNSANTRSYPFSYSVGAANTWTVVSVTIPGDTTGTWLTNNGIGIDVVFGLGVGSTFSGTAGAWAGSNFLSATGAVSVVGTNGATFYLTGVQLEVGSAATPFERRQYGQELALCQRYAYVLQGQGGFTPFGYGAYVNTTQLNIYIPFPVQMRASPAVSYSAANTFYVDNGTVSSITSDQVGPYSIVVAPTISGTATAGSPSRLLANNNSTALITITAEL
jgi:hypothetical protein